MALYRALDREAVEPPFEWVISRVCEEFHCTPSQAYREVMDDPNRTAMKVMEMRGFARAFREINSAEKGKQPDGPEHEEVYYIRHLVVKEDRAREQSHSSD